MPVFKLSALDWFAMSRGEKILHLTRENAYYMWERRVALKMDGSPEQDWEMAKNYVRISWSYLFETTKTAS